MASTHQILPPGFVRFEPYWHHQVKQALTSAFWRKGYDIYIWKQAQDFLTILSPFQLMAVSKKIYSLASSPRPDDARHKKNAVDKYYIPELDTGFSIEYEIVNGAVYVKSIIPDPDSRGKHKEIPGVYHVKRDEFNLWEVKRTPTYQVNTKYAAVNGQSNVLERAKDLMAEHVSYAYDKGLTEYTLFHNPSDGGVWDTYESSQDKKGNTTGVSKEFAKVLKNVQTVGTPVGWVAHSQGGVIFTEAVRYHFQQEGSSLDKNSVWFHAGANSWDKTTQYLPKAGVTVHGYNDHPFDFVPQLVGGHAISMSNVVGSVLHAGYVVFGNSERSPHTLPFEGMDNYVDKMPTAYRNVYNGAKAAEGAAESAFQYIDNIPSRIKACFKLIKK